MCVEGLQGVELAIFNGVNMNPKIREWTRSRHVERRAHSGWSTSVNSVAEGTSHLASLSRICTAISSAEEKKVAVRVTGCGEGEMRVHCDL